MSDQKLAGKRILITHADQFMGPVLCEVFARQGATVIADTSPLLAADAPAELVAATGKIDVLVANLAMPAPTTAATEVSEDEWHDAFAVLVHPLARCGRRSRGLHGRGLGMKRASTYSAARGAQLAYVQAIGVEVAPHNVQVNAIAQNFVDNPTYFPADVQANPRFQERLKREVPLGRLVGADEDAEFAAYLCSDSANCFVGQVFPVCGGWVTR
ncbi:MAG: SDR family oxidoreductase [Betaproteobacteria bacterium]|nr:SDR family oxidoreductase [Betaproteobacteria bacterium]